MKQFKRIFCFIFLLTFIITGNLLPPFVQVAKAAVNINLEMKNIYHPDPPNRFYNEVILAWNSVAGAEKYEIKYRDHTGTLQIISENQPGVTQKTITGLESGYIYDFEITAYKADNTPIELYNNTVSVITEIPFYASRVERTADELRKQLINDNEVGQDPSLKIEIELPKEWDYTAGSYKSVWGEGYNYRIDMGNKKDSFDLGAFKIIWSEGRYKIYLTDREDPSKEIETNAEVKLEENKIKFNIDRSWFPRINPGSIFYGEILPIFSEDKHPYKRIESKLKEGTNAFTYTFLHAVVSVGSHNTVLIHVDSVNKGAINQDEMGDFTYTVYSGKDPDRDLIRTFEGTQPGPANPNDPIPFMVVGKEYSTTYYYKIIAQSADGKVIVESPVIVFNISRGGIVSPLPEEVSVLRVERKDNTADITIRWRKPEQYNNIHNKLKYMFELNSIEQHDPDRSERIGDKDYPLVYRKVFEIELKDDNFDVDPVTGIKTHKSNGSILDDTDNFYILLTIPGEQIKDMDYSGEEAHPNYDPLDLGKIYYLRMRSKFEDVLSPSDYSLPVSFTTVKKVEPPVPVPDGLDTHTNDDGTKAVGKDFIHLSWQQVQINWANYDAANVAPQSRKIYYELYVSTRPDRVSDASDANYGAFIDQPPGTVVYAVYGESGNVKNIRDGSPSSISYAVVENSQLLKAEIGNLLPDTTYYFIVRTRLEVEGMETIYSSYSNIYTEHTSRGDVVPPGDDERTLVAPDPSSFKISVDKNGNPEIYSNRVKVEWAKVHTKENNYRVICTRQPIGPKDKIEDIRNSGQLVQEYTVDRNNDWDIYTKWIEELIVNSQYYVSVRAEAASLNPSDWITIPVTTKMLEAPTQFQIVYDDKIDRKHQIKLRWRALDSPNYQFDVAIRSEQQEVYTELTSVNVQPGDSSGGGYNTFEYVITGLTHNTRYYVKVRMRDTETGAISKYTQTLTTRTEFSQEDYDDEEEDIDNDVKLQDRIKKYIDSYLWVYRNTSRYYNVKVRGDKAINYINNSSQPDFVIDISHLKNKDAYDKTIYIPYKVIELLNSKNKSLVIKTENGDIHFRPNSLDDRISAVSNMKARLKSNSIQDIFIKISFDNLKSSSTYKPSSLELRSNISQLAVDVQGFNITDKQIENEILVWLYGSDGNGGRVKAKRDELLAIPDNQKDTDEELEAIIQRLLNELDEELGEYIRTRYMENSSRIRYSSEVERTSVKLLLNLKYNVTSGSNEKYYGGYINTGSGKNWSKVESVTGNGICTLETYYPAKYAVLSSQPSSIGDLIGRPDGQDIQDMDARYNIMSIFGSYISFYPDRAITTREAVLLYERVLAETASEFAEAGDEERVKRLGLSDVINVRFLDRSLSRQEAAYLVMKLYEVKSGTSVKQLKVPANISFIDEKNIRTDLYKYAALACAYNFMQVQNNKFNPAGTVTRAEMVVAMKKVLEKLGEI